MIIEKNSMAVLNAAIAYAQIENYDIYSVTVLGENGLYEVCFATDIMSYSMFVDSESLEVIGFDASPVGEDEAELHFARCA